MSYDSWKTTPPDFFDDPDKPEECESCGASGVKLAHCWHPRQPEWLCGACAGDDEPRDPCEAELPFAENE